MVTGDLLLDPDAGQLLEPAEELRARPLRIRLELDPAFALPWLGLLAVCAWLRGRIIGNERSALDVDVDPRWPYPQKRVVDGRVVEMPDPWEQYKEWRRVQGDEAWQ